MSNLFVVWGRLLQGINEIHLLEGDNGILEEGGMAGTSTASYKDTERTPQLCLQLFWSFITTLAYAMPAVIG
jgi:hypothetical protein